MEVDAQEDNEDDHGCDGAIDVRPNHLLALVHILDQHHFPLALFLHISALHLNYVPVLNNFVGLVHPKDKVRDLSSHESVKEPHSVLLGVSKHHEQEDATRQHCDCGPDWIEVVQLAEQAEPKPHTHYHHSRLDSEAAATCLKLHTFFLFFNFNF